jgi:hypothetical protein
VRRAARWLERAQNADGGYALQAGPSNAQSTAWAVQGLIAAGRDPAQVRRGGGRSPLAYLRSLVGPDGAIRYSRTSAQTPVWVTAQALTALAGKALPLAPARRATATTPAPEPTPAPTATPAPKPAATATPEPEPLATATAQPVAPAATPVRIVALAYPAISPALGRRAGIAFAIAARTWLP